MAKPLVIAHRGASVLERENTIAAFERAADLGADWVELDVRRTADGAMAVHHDPALRDGRLLIDTLSTDVPAEVPALGAALDACAGMGVNIEIKNSPREPDFDEGRMLAVAVVELVASRAGAPPVLVSSFDWKTIERVRSIDASVPTAWLVHSSPDMAAAIERCAAAGHAAFHPWAPTVDDAMVGACHAAGLRVNTWTVDDPEWMRRLAEMGLDGIVTNVPDVARAALD